MDLLTTIQNCIHLSHLMLIGVSISLSNAELIFKKFSGSRGAQGLNSRFSLEGFSITSSSDGIVLYSIDTVDLMSSNVRASIFYYSSLRFLGFLLAGLFI